MAKNPEPTRYVDPLNRYRARQLKDALTALNQAAELFEAGEPDRALACIQIAFPYLVRTLPDSFTSISQAFGCEDFEAFLTLHGLEAES